jgi:hypothetical protein
MNFIHFYHCVGIYTSITLFSLCTVVFANTYFRQPAEIIWNQNLQNNTFCLLFSSIFLSHNVCFRKTLLYTYIFLCYCFTFYFYIKRSLVFKIVYTSITLFSLCTVVFANTYFRQPAEIIWNQNLSLLQF